MRECLATKITTKVVALDCYSNLISIRSLHVMTLIGANRVGEISGACDLIYKYSVTDLTRLSFDFHLKEATGVAYFHLHKIRSDQSFQGKIQRLKP